MKKFILLFSLIIVFAKAQTPPLQPSPIIGPTLVCNGSIYTYSVTNDPLATLYSWTLPGGWTGTSITNFITTTVSNPSGVMAAVASNSAGVSPTRTLNVTSQFTVNTSFSNVSCMGSSNGSANAIPLGGVSPYAYIWQPTGSITQSVNNFNPGTYTVYVTDASGCLITKTVTITQPAALTAIVTGTNVNCNGLNNGIGNVNYAGGTGIPAILWQPGLQVVQTPINLTAPQIHTVTLTDANGCSLTRTLNITQPTVLAGTLNNIVSTNCNQSNGSASLTVSGGIGPYSYQWSSNPTFTNSFISGVYAGAYTVNFSDANGCSQSQIAAINNIAGPNINALISTSISCNGLSNGTASISASGTGSLSYLWSYLSQTTNSVNNLPVGIHTVTVNDPYTCSSTATFNISQPPAITLTAIANNTVVCLGNSSTLTANVIGGGVPPYTYTWSSGGNASIKIVTPITATTYTINIKDANNCLKTNTVSVATNSLPIITTSTSGSLTCSNSAVNIYATTGAGLLYSWNGSGIVSGANSATAVVNAPGIYSVNVTSSVNGCSVIKTVTVSLNNAIPLIFIFSSPSLICSGQTATLMASGANTYAWSSGGTSATEIVSPTTNTIYTVNGTDVNGCSNIATSNITVNPLPIINTTSSNSLICTGQTVTLTATGATTYTWSSGGNSITEVVSPTVNTTYTVNGTDGNGCSNSSSITQNVSLCTGLAIQSGVEAQSISVFPNPTNGILNVASTSSATELQILNVLGQVVQTTNIINQTTQLNISDLKNGLYFVKVLEGNKVIATQKIIKE